MRLVPYLCRRLLPLSLLLLTFACGSSSSEAGQTDTPAATPTQPATPQVLIGNRRISDLIEVSRPVPETEVSSPLTIRGRARGLWFHEGTFPVELQNSDGETIVTGVAQAQGDWMTEDWAPFEATLEFTPQHMRGYVLLERANPSERVEQSRSMRIPILFPKPAQ